MRKTTTVLIGLALMAGAAFADVGDFTSFTTTITPMPGAFEIDALLETTGGSPSYSDTVFMTFFFQNVDNSTDWGWDGGWVHRDGTTNTFPLSYTATGLIPNHQYKWVMEAENFTGTWSWDTWSAFESARDDIWSSYIDPFVGSSSVSAYSFILNYNAASPFTGAIHWAANLTSGVASVHQPNLLEVPTLGQWGLLALGGSLLGLGVVALRRTRI